MKFGDEVVLIRGSRGRGPESGPGFERRLRANVEFRRGEALACNAGLGVERPGKD